MDNYYNGKVELVAVATVISGVLEVGMELVDTEESISLPKASFRPITVLVGGGGGGENMTCGKCFHSKL